MKRSAKIAVSVGILLTLAACAAGSPDAARAAGGGALSQLVLGFWHGIIAPITLLIEVLRRYVPGLIPWPWRLYQGGGASVPYDIGFYFGLAGGPSFVFWRRGG